MVTDRLEVRLDPERRLKLSKIAAERGTPVSEVVRRLIDEAYEEVQRAHRLHLVEEMAKMNLPVPEDPEELSRQLAKAHDPGSVY